MLNINATFFKLETLDPSAFRYENIYKNLLREVRRHCIAMFNKSTKFITKRTHIKEQTFFSYVDWFLNEVIGPETLASLEYDPKEATFLFGAFVYPKYATNSLTQLFPDLESSALDNLISEVNEINDTVYKFSLERLHKFVKKPFLMALFLSFTESSLLQTFLRKDGNSPYVESYQEAISKMDR